MDIYPICQEDFHFSQKITGNAANGGGFFSGSKNQVPAIGKHPAGTSNPSDLPMEIIGS